jgi:hypothetical protein
LNGEQGSLVVDHKVQLEAVEPIYAAATAWREARQDFVVLKAAVVADRPGQAIDEGNALALPQARPQVSGQGHQDRRQTFDQTLLAEQVWKLRAPVATHWIEVEIFEIAVGRSLKGDQ